MTPDHEIRVSAWTRTNLDEFEAGVSLDCSCGWGHEFEEGEAPTIREVNMVIDSHMRTALDQTSRYKQGGHIAPNPRVVRIEVPHGARFGDIEGPA